MATANSRLRTVKVTAKAAQNSEQIPNSQVLRGATNKTVDPKYPIMYAAKTANAVEELSFQFPFPPQQVSYSNIAPEMTQIERAGRTPIIAFSRVRLKQVDLQFMVAVPLDGLRIDIEEDLQTLEAIAKSNRPVWFFGFDRFISDTFATTLTESTFFWTITELSFSSIRRNTAQRIVQAEVQMSIVENRNPVITASTLPRINYSADPKRRNPPPNTAKPPEQQFLEWTDVYEVNTGVVDPRPVEPGR